MIDRPGELTIGGLAVTALAARVGRTPFFAYDRAAIAARIAELRAAIPRSVEVVYSMKANPLPAVVEILAREVDGVDVASAGELVEAIRAGVAPDRIGFAGPGKSDDELTAALDAGVVVHVESAGELARHAAIAAARGARARVMIRVNPPFRLDRAGLRMGGGAAPFGIDAEQVPALLRALPAALELVGVHVFAGAQCLDATAVAEAQSRTLDLAIDLARSSPTPFRRVALGGGFGIPYFRGESALDLRHVGDHMHRLAGRAAGCLPGATLAIELGRFLVGEAGFYVCRVLDRKESRGRVFLVTDGGLHHHLSAAGRLGGPIRRNFPIVPARAAREVETVSVVGRLCTPLDVLADDVELPRVETGELLVIKQSGAYGPTASPGQFLGHPPAIEVLV